MLFLLIVPIVMVIGYMVGRHREQATLRGIAEMAVARLFVGRPTSTKLMLRSLLACRFIPAVPLDLSLAAISSVVYVIVRLCAPAWEALPMICVVAGLSAYFHTVGVGKGAKVAGRKMFVVVPPRDKAA